MNLTKLCAAIYILFILVSSVAADNQKSPSPPSHLTVLKDLFGVDNLDSSGAVKTAENESTSVWFEQAFKYGQDNLYVFFISTKYEDTCVACGGGSFGAITYKQINGQWQIVSKQFKLGSAGRMGFLPDLEHVNKIEFATNKVGLFIHVTGEAGQGNEYSGAFLYVFYNNQWNDLGYLDTGFNDFGSCDDVSRPCSGVKGKLSIVNKKDSEYPDLIVTLSQIDAKEIPLKDLPNKNARYLFNGQKYIEQCNYFDQFVRNKDGTVTDPRNGTIWQKCNIGQTWNGKVCKGKTTEMPWWSAMQEAKKNRFLGHSDWRLPTFNELNAITGSSGVCGKQSGPAHAVSLILASPIDKEKSFGVFWSSSTYVDYFDYAFATDFTEGYSYSHNREVDIAVRLVRDGNPKGKEEFEREFAKIADYKASYLNQKRQEEQQEKNDAIEAKTQVKQTASGYESCYDLNYRFGRCVAMMQNGYSCKQEDDFAMPERCRGGAESDRGLRAGMESGNSM